MDEHLKQIIKFSLNTKKETKSNLKYKIFIGVSLGLLSVTAYYYRREIKDFIKKMIN